MPGLGSRGRSYKERGKKNIHLKSNVLASRDPGEGGKRGGERRRGTEQGGRERVGGREKMRCGERTEKKRLRVPPKRNG